MKPIVTRCIATLCCLFSLPLSAADLSSKLADQPPSFGPKPGEPWENSLGMKFVPVPGTNVLWEWCGDWYNVERKTCAIRGASFNQGAPGRLMSSYRAPKPPGVREYNLGFRCVVKVGASSP